mmetsp:Transcript_11209/g.25953  ORF Transcript_11209/g.25953 Transcript_11209/m.25953 type:complete len:148 (+) Transcript_11209:118-561(+)|eukprot:CAMPEP_0116841270 /NCGR_PEP_ID=MMETSP0418-20121206/10829_1 /TAXON_ID=1158023 /ORGANISM="Astrosyne radiata, Strain 13vi08-1A" /LENGTH=147 /DNA_ID=CAMNT_0004471673 /DNA_START=120 /DNA_END=563 /DNA_ORIENTATION=+
MATRRLMKERTQLEKDPLEYCQIEVGSDMFSWKVNLQGPASTPYAGGSFWIKVEFPTQYPFKPPMFQFITKVYHPSVELETGKICADIMNEGWGPTLNVRHCLQIIYGLLQAPDGDHPLEESIAQQLREKPKEFEKMAKKYTRDFAN